MRETPKSERLSELLAKLTFDTSEWAVASIDDLRAVVATVAKEDGRIDVAVHLQPNRAGALDGLLGTNVVLEASDRTFVAEARIDDRGHLAFKGVPLGKYRLAIGRKQEAPAGLETGRQATFASPALAHSVRTASLDLVEAGRADRWRCDDTPWPSTPLPLSLADWRPRLWNWANLTQDDELGRLEPGPALARALGWSNVDWRIYGGSFRRAVERSAGMAGALGYQEPRPRQKRKPGE